MKRSPLKRIVFLIAPLSLTFLFLLLSACSNETDDPAKSPSHSATDDIGLNTPNNENNNTQQHLQRQLSERVSVDAQVIIPNITSLPTVDVDLVTFDSDVIRNALFDPASIVTEEVVYAGSLGITQLIDDSDFFCSYWTYDKDSVLRSHTGSQEYIFYLFRWQERYTNTELFSTELELGFASRDFVINEILNAVKSLGIGTSSLGEPLIYSLDHETLATENMRKRDDGEFEGYRNFTFKENWTDEDDYYFILWEFEAQEISIVSEEMRLLLNDDIVRGSKIAALYSQRGIEYLEITNAFTETSTGSASQIISLEDAMSAMVAKFESIISTNRYVITDIKLKYIPEFKDRSRTSQQLIPVWDISIAEYYSSHADSADNDILVGHIQHYLIDAYTGREYV